MRESPIFDVKDSPHLPVRADTSYTNWSLVRHRDLMRTSKFNVYAFTHVHSPAHCAVVVVMNTSSSSNARNGVSYSAHYATTTTSRPHTGRSRPRTAATSTGYGETNEIICALSESRGISPTVGLSFVNLSTSEAVLCQFADTQTYARTCHKIKVFGPSEIIHMNTAIDSKLLSIVHENLEVGKHDILMTSIDRRYWSESTGYEYLQHLAFPSDLESLKLSIGGNYFAACCFAAVGLQRL